MKLKPTIQTFVNTYLANGNNATQAYIEAFPNVKPNVAASAGSRLLKRVDVQEALEAPIEVEKRSLFSSRQRVLDRLEQLADKAEQDQQYATATKAVESGAKFAGLHDMSDAPLQQYNLFITNLVQQIKGDNEVIDVQSE